jgi:hypothetical protein
VLWQAKALEMLVRGIEIEEILIFTYLAVFCLKNLIIFSHKESGEELRIHQKTEVLESGLQALASMG